MAVIDHDAELTTGRRQRARLGRRRCCFFMRRYPLGAIGALIMILFVATALFAD